MHITAGYAGVNIRAQDQLVASPTGLSAVPLVNYTTWLRWSEPEQDDDITVYDVYRTPKDGGETELIAEDLPDLYFYDYNLYYGQTFDYYVVAKKPFVTQTGTYFAFSEPSYCVRATIVDEGEMHKYLGLQSHWSYTTMQIGNSTAYVNVANGNLVYQKTDFMNTAPLLASVMRRTFNSQSTAGGPFGVGWDFSFNTNLLTEYGIRPGGPCRPAV